MSVSVSAMMSHASKSFSMAWVEEIARAVANRATDIKWFQHPVIRSPEEEFAAEGTVSFFLPNEFTVNLGKRILILGHADRWSRFLLNKSARERFLSACSNVAQLTGAMEALVLPDGTIVRDQLYAGAEFENTKRVATEELGPPDLDIQHIYTESELKTMGQSRVHYFLLRMA